MEKKYDVAVYGLWYGNNYGSMITYYALSKVLESMNLTYAMIKNPLGANVDVKQLRRSHPLCFADGRYNITPLLRLNEMNQLNDMFDIFLLGSDQMWNYGLSRPYGQSYFFDFVNDDKIKIAYATSFGKNKYNGPDSERGITKTNLQRFDAISVRDDFSKKICENDFDTPAKLVLDPVFLCPVEKYHDLIRETDFSVPEEFIFAYILDPNKEIGQSIQQVAESTKKKVIVVFNEASDVENCKRNLDISSSRVEYLTNTTVQEWLYLYKNARFVLTDSFHGSCFSIIFKKPFVVLKNNGRGGGRFSYLLGEFGLLNYMVESPKAIAEKFFSLGLEHQIDYDSVYKRIDVQKNLSMKWFEHALKTHEKKPVSMESKFGKTITMHLPVEECVGCGACVSTCPAKALELKPDEHGFYRSVLNETTCINCGKCLKVCPAYKLPSNPHTKTPNCYAAIASDAELLKKSSSGGIFSLLAKKAFEKQGVVGGAAWKDDLSVEHILIEQESELPKLRKSKYLQSYLGNIDAQVKKRLEQGQFVLFSGCPCQIAGLRAYLGKDYENLITVDLFCGNAPSAGFFQKYLQDAFGDQVERYEFRDKSKGWNCIAVKADLKNGTQVLRQGTEQDAYQKAFHSHTMCAPHCQNCKYQQLPRFGDITIGDFWGISKRMPEFDYTKGVSVVLCNSEKGRAFFDQISEQELALKKEVPLKWIGGNGYVLEGKHNYASPYRDAFFDKIQTKPFSEAVKLAFDQHKLTEVPSEQLNPLQFHSQQVGFQYDFHMWEQHFIQGKLVLIPKEQKPTPGNYASMPLSMSLKKGKQYHLYMRFKIQTETQWLNLHIKEAGSKRLQIIHRHKVQPNDAKEWVTISKDFVPNNDIYSEFMVGAMQIAGEGRFLAIDYLYITEAKP